MKTQQIIIIGLGQFGLSLARTLTDKGAEVLAIDAKKELVEDAAAFVTDAMILDATDEEGLARLEPAKRDAVVCAIGDDSREASIICVALLRQMGVPMIIARANDDIHKRILHLVGANQVINPEKEYGMRFANRILYRNVIADSRLGDDLQLTEIHAREDMIGKSLQDLDLQRRFGITVAAIRRMDSGLNSPTASYRIEENDHLVIVCSDESISKFVDSYNENR